MELLTVNVRRVYSTLTPNKIIELLRLGEKTNDTESPLLGIGTDQLCDAFYGILGFPRLEDERVLKRAIVDGIDKGAFGFVGRADRVDKDRVREGSKYYISRSLAIIGKQLGEDEIDLNAGFIVLPAGIEAETPIQSTEISVQEPTSQPSEQGTDVIYEVKRTETGAGQPQTRVRFRVNLNRQQVYASFNAFANLADKAGTIELIVDAQSLQGFDPVWLRNAVVEPLEEADVKVTGIDAG